MGTGINGVDLKKATSDLRAQAGLDKCQTIRKEGAPIPLKPLEKWDNEDNVVLAGDAAGVVAPSSGEGIYYAMIGGQYASEAVEKSLLNNNPKYLAAARSNFMKEHKAVFQVLEQCRTLTTGLMKGEKDLLHFARTSTCKELLLKITCIKNY